MLGAYTTYVVQLWMPDLIGVSLLVAVPAAFLVAGAAGVVIERTVIRFLYGRPLETLLATFGVSLVLQQLVRSVFSANNRAVVTPAWMSGTLQFNEAFSLTWNRLYIVLFAMVVFALVLGVLRYTRLGLDIRAVSQNRTMARAMGVRTEWVDAMTFGLGAGIAGVAGVALTQLTNVGPNLGQSYIVDSFMAWCSAASAICGARSSAAWSLGIVTKLLEPFAGAVLGKILVLIALILFIQRRPRGLFPQTGPGRRGRVMRAALRLPAVIADRDSLVFLAALVAVALAAPLLNHAVPDSSPLHLSSYAVGLMASTSPTRCSRSPSTSSGLLRDPEPGATPRSSRSGATRWGCTSCARSGPEACTDTRPCRTSWCF